MEKITSLGAKILSYSQTMNSRSVMANRPPVIILNWNGWEDTLECLRSLVSLKEAQNVWLVDNASRLDRTAEVSSQFPGVRIFRWDDNYGWAGGYNRVLKIAVQEGYEFAYLLNNDTLVEPEFLNSALTLAHTDPKIAAVGSLIVYMDAENTLKFDGLYYEPGVKPLDEAKTSLDMSEANGAGMLVRLEAMNRDGYFDERFFCYHEEKEWCWRLRQLGWKIAVCAQSRIRHHCEHSNVGANSLYYRTRNAFLLSAYDEGKSNYKRKYHGAVTGFCRLDSKMGREANLAILQGIRDGLTGCFGKRRECPTGQRLWISLWGWYVVFKLRHFASRLLGRR